MYLVYMLSRFEIIEIVLDWIRFLIFWIFLVDWQFLNKFVHLCNLAKFQVWYKGCTTQCRCYIWLYIGHPVLDLQARERWWDPNLNALRDAEKVEMGSPLLPALWYYLPHQYIVWYTSIMKMMIWWCHNDMTVYIY